MRRESYNEYAKLLNSALKEEETLNFDNSVLDDKDTNEITFTIKNY